MADFAIPLSITGVALVAFLVFRRPITDLLNRTTSVGKDGLRASAHPQLAAVTPAEQTHQQEILRITSQHTQTHAKDQRTIAELTQAQAKDQKTIARLTASNAAKDAEIVRLKAQIPRQNPPLTAEEFFKPSPPKKPASNDPFSGLLS